MGVLGPEKPCRVGPGTESVEETASVTGFKSRESLPPQDQEKRGRCSLRGAMGMEEERAWGWGGRPSAGMK